MLCPICGSPAKGIFARDFSGESIRCPVDGDFDIMRGVRAKLAALDTGQRELVLSRAIIEKNGRPRPCVTESAFLVLCR
jgi:hypothetical protein